MIESLIGGMGTVMALAPLLTIVIGIVLGHSDRRHAGPVAVDGRRADGAVHLRHVADPGA
jgi:hypothetical protein